jgi:hypothetical protein
MPLNPLNRPNLSGLNGAIPAVYDPMWQTYTDLSPTQILAFQGFPQDLAKYIAQVRWQWEIAASWAQGPSTPGITLPANIGAISGIQLMVDDRSKQLLAGLRQGLDTGDIVPGPNGFPFIAVNGVFMLQAADIKTLVGYVFRWVQASFATAAQALAAVNANPQAITTRAQVDSLFQSTMVVK